MDFGKISPKSRMITAIGITINSWGNRLDRSRNTVAKEVVRIFDIFVPIRMTVRYSGFLSRMEEAQIAMRFFCFSHTSSCRVLAERRAISELE
jgi:hypothetical protein